MIGHVTLATCLLLCIAANPAAQELGKPNYVVIMVDDMSYAGVSCFGNPYFRTPEIDRLAAEGIKLTDFHSSGTVCSPTRAGLLTGRYQQRAGIEAVIHPVSDHPEHRKGLRKSETTIAELLKEAGYSTGLIGKWHQGYPHNSADYATDLINRYAVDFIERHRDKPFCLYVSHLAIHNPVQVRGDPVRRTEEEGWKRWKPADKAERIEKFRGITLPIDEGVGQIRLTLVRLGLDRSTLVLFFSDNGASADFPSGSPKLRGRKGSVYEGGHKVPFIAWWPDRIDAGTVNDTPAITLDVMPTLLALANVEPPKQHPLDGVDLSPLLLESRTLPGRPLYWASLSNRGSRSEAMREGPWKLVVQHPKAKPGSFENEVVELYRLDRDPAEQSNLAAKEPDRTAAMLRKLKDWYADTQRTATKQPGGW